MTATAIQHLLASRADHDTREWWTAYLKGSAQFRGVKTADVRSVVHTWLESDGADWSHRALRDLAISLIEAPFTEDKIAGMLLLQEHLIPADAVPWKTEVRRWARLFDADHLSDWNSCDWFSVRVLGPIAVSKGEPAARAIAGWSTAQNLWRRRAAGVAFVNLAPDGDENFRGFVELVLEVCARTVRSPERFAQTGTGWVLRELSRADPAAVTGFVDAHAPLLSSEALRMAVAKLPLVERARLAARRTDGLSRT